MGTTAGLPQHRHQPLGARRASPARWTRTAREPSTAPRPTTPHAHDASPPRESALNGTSPPSNPSVRRPARVIATTLPSASYTRSTRPAPASRSTCEYVARRPHPIAKPSGSRPATSNRATHANASRLLGPGPPPYPSRPPPHRPAASPPHHRSSPARRTSPSHLPPSCFCLLRFPPLLTGLPLNSPAARPTIPQIPLLKECIRPRPIHL